MLDRIATKIRFRFREDLIESPPFSINFSEAPANIRYREVTDQVDNYFDLKEESNAETGEINYEQQSDALLENVEEDFSNGFENDEKLSLAKSGENVVGETELNENECWLNLNASSHFKIMNELEAKYSSSRLDFNNKVVKTLNENMLKALLENRGIAYRALQNTGGDPSQIPAGLNLGGYSMLRMPDSILFFHRMKLRNNTVFRVDFFENDLVDMSVTARLRLNDLHLVGAYERSFTHKNPSILFYTPSFGEIEILLKNVYYNMEGRLRLQNKRLVIEVVDSVLTLKDDILMTYLDSKDNKPMRLQKQNLEDFLARMKNDLDLWLKDYFNDYYTYFQLDEEDENFKNYEKSRIIAYNNYADFAIRTIRQRMYDLGILKVKIPKFTLFSIPNVQVKLYNGVIRGLNTMFRRSIATGKRVKDVRYVDMMVGFANLRVEYALVAVLPNKTLNGRLLLTADDLAAHLQIAMVKDPEAINLKFDFVKQYTPESLVVEGPASRFIANFRHLIENHAIAIMSNVLIYNINMLSTLAKCDPNLNIDDRPNAYSLGRPSSDSNLKLFNPIKSFGDLFKSIGDGSISLPVQVGVENSGNIVIGDNNVVGMDINKHSDTPYQTTQKPNESSEENYEAIQIPYESSAKNYKTIQKPYESSAENYKTSTQKPYHATRTSTIWFTITRKPTTKPKPPLIPLTTRRPPFNRNKGK